MGPSYPGIPRGAMNPSTWKQLNDKIRSLTLGTDPGMLKPWLDKVPDVEQCIADGLLGAAEAEEWSMFERYLIVAHQRPSRSYTSVLCRVLSERRDDVNNEDIVDVPRDRRSIGNKLPRGRL